MQTLTRLCRAFALAAALTAAAGAARAADIAVPGAPCNPPPNRCPDAKCAGVVAEPGNVTEPASGRKFFLDYACGLKAGDTAIFILNVHGIGGNANWQRHYFPAVDYKDKYKLIVATPKSAGTSFNAAVDDAYVLGVIDYVVKAFPGVKLKVWVAGHSAGGGYSRSFMCKDSAVKGQILGSISLAGGRLGGVGSPFPAEAAAQLRGRGLAGPPPGAAGVPGPGAPGPGRGGPPGGGAPACGQFSHIYETGDIDSLGGNPVPATSTVAKDLGCGERVKVATIVDTKGGEVYDARDREAPLPGWGKEARPGTAEFYRFPGCPAGRVVADFVRPGKGHTEGLEPKVTEEIIKLVAAASK